MLVIRQEQILTLDQKSLEQFVEHATLYLRDRYPENMVKFGYDGLRSLILEGVDRAELYGIDDEADVLRFLEMIIRHGPCFDEELDWAREILSCSHSSGSSKMDELDDYQLFAIDLVSTSNGEI